MTVTGRSGSLKWHYLNHLNDSSFSWSKLGWLWQDNLILEVLGKKEQTFWSIDLNLLSILTFDFLFRWTGLNFELVLNFSNLSSPPLLTIFLLLVSKFTPTKRLTYNFHFFCVKIWTKIHHCHHIAVIRKWIWYENGLVFFRFSQKTLKLAFLLMIWLPIDQNSRLHSSVGVQVKVFYFSKTSNWSLWDRNKVINSCFFRTKNSFRGNDKRAS